MVIASVRPFATSRRDRTPSAPWLRTGIGTVPPDASDDARKHQPQAILGTLRRSFCYMAFLPTAIAKCVAGSDQASADRMAG
ncbi:hypothetical protein ASG43_00615 [Aureimonas sp. Leaf454]|nr:hypothetical protein ASG43_00615 [Aureimonas sp. Leaf454]